jgi:RNA polymerase sigma factor (sigma-70 family)
VAVPWFGGPGPQPKPRAGVLVGVATDLLEDTHGRMSTSDLRRTSADPADPPTDHRARTEERLRGGLIRDLDAGFADVVRTHQDVLYAVARHLSYRAADSEDLAAEALLRAYRALRGYDAARINALSIRPWLLTILRNTARNAIRDAARRPAPPSTFEPADEVAAAPGPAQLAEQADTQRRLGTALAELSDVQRTAVALRHVVGLPTSEVAQVLGCKDGTAKSHISRGLRRLRELLADSGTGTTGTTNTGSTGSNGTSVE